MNVPDELVAEIARRNVVYDYRHWMRWRGTSTQFRRASWLTATLLDELKDGDLSSSVTQAFPSDGEYYGQAAIKFEQRRPLRRRGRSSGVEIAAGIARTPSGGFLLLHPGVYSENVRLSKNMCIIGLGPPGSVVIEGAGWEPTISNSGLGVDHDALENEAMQHVKVRETGESASIVNVVITHRNEGQAVVVYVPIGEPSFIECDIRGGVRICGGKSNPLFSRCQLSLSRATAIMFTDYARGTITGSKIAHCRGPAVVLDRSAEPELIGVGIDWATVKMPAIVVSTSAKPRAMDFHEHHSGWFVKRAGCLQHASKDASSHAVRCFVYVGHMGRACLRIVCVENLIRTMTKASDASTSTYGNNSERLNVEQYRDAFGVNLIPNPDAICAIRPDPSNGIEAAQMLWPWWGNYLGLDAVENDDDSDDDSLLGDDDIGFM